MICDRVSMAKPSWVSRLGLVLSFGLRRADKVTTGSGSDRVSTLHAALDPKVETRSLPLPVLTSCTWQAKCFSRGSTALTTGQLSYRLKGVNLLNCLVLPQTYDARKAQGKSAFVPV